MKIQVFRLSSSSYQTEDFITQERTILEKIPGISYANTIDELDQDAKYILISNTHTLVDQIPQFLLDQTLMLIHPNSGFDNFTEKFKEKVNFPIVKGNPIRAYAVAEYILSCIFHHFTKIPNHAFWDEKRSWSRKLVKDQKVLIIGFGFIGSKVYQSLSPLVSNISVIDPYKDILKKQFYKEYDRSHFDSVDVLIICSELNDSSHNMIKQDLLDRLASDALIVNAARSQIIHPSDLNRFLIKNTKAKAYLDVFEEEPFKASELNKYPNINKTSHIAGVFNHLNQEIISYEELIIKEYLGFFKESNIDGFREQLKDYILQ